MQNDLEYRLFKEELTLAPISKRVLAFIVDTILLVLIVIAAMGDKFAGKNIEQTINAMNQALLFIMLVEIAYHAVFVRLYGATIGKMILKIRVVDINMFANPTWASSVIRASIRFMGETPILCLIFLWAFFDPFRQGWHDKFAKTLVINAA